MFGYNLDMEKYILADTGREKRYNKALSLDDIHVNSVIEVAKKHIAKGNRNLKTFKNYEKYRSKILADTHNYKEKAIVFDDSGVLILEKLGNNKAIRFTEKEVSLMRGKSLIHNHPSGQTLSFEDVLLAINGGLKEIVAFTGKGTYFKLIVKDNLDINDIRVQYVQAKKDAASVINTLISKGVFTKEQADLEYKHFIMSIFSQKTKGVKYEQTRY